MINLLFCDAPLVVRMRKFPAAGATDLISEGVELNAAVYAKRERKLVGLYCSTLL